MSRPRIPPPAQLVVSVLSSRLTQIWPDLERQMQARWGQLDFVSDPFAFTQTSYYDQELGTPIMRRMISFQQLVSQDRLPEIKLITNTLEDTWRRTDGRRQVNLDPRPPAGEPGPGPAVPGAIGPGNRQELYPPHLFGPGDICRSDPDLSERGVADSALDFSGLCRGVYSRGADPDAGQV